MSAPDHGVSTERGTHWSDLAACRGSVDPELWFPASDSARDQIAAAKAVCAGCPVRLDCLAYAERTEGKHWTTRNGIRGGLTAKERARLARGGAA